VTSGLKSLTVLNRDTRRRNNGAKREMKRD
jgi:hypothetical protein